jgi:hypothetical protein
MKQEGDQAWNTEAQAKKSEDFGFIRNMDIARFGRQKELHQADHQRETPAAGLI